MIFSGAELMIGKYREEEIQGKKEGEVNGNPLQYSCLENSLDRRAMPATVHGVAKSRTQVSDLTLSLLLS